MDIEKELEALKLLKDWSIWLVSTQTVILGVITVFTGNSKLNLNLWSEATICFFILSIFVATWILGAIPDIAQRLTPGDKKHHIKLFAWFPVKLWVASLSQHILFIIGIIALGGYLLSTPVSSEQDKQKKAFEKELQARLAQYLNCLNTKPEKKNEAVQKSE